MILGNSPQINDIDFSRLRSDVITVGVNRIWHVHYPNYFFFHDFEILLELEKEKEKYDELMSKSKIISSDWLRYRAAKAKRALPKNVKIHRRVNIRKFPDSVTTCLEIIATNYFPKHNYSFYIAGVSLKWQEPSHFWKGVKQTRNSHGRDWYERRFNLMYQNWTLLQKQRYKIYSVTPGSMLNKQYKYIKIENLYK